MPQAIAVKKNGKGQTAKDAPQKNPMVEHVVSEFERYESHWADKFRKAEAFYDHWSNKPPTKDFDWENAVHVPLTVEAEQTITPRLFTALFPTDAPVDVTSEGGADPQAGIKIKGLIQHFFKVTNIQNEAVPMLSQNTLFGTGYMETGSWLVRRGWMTGVDGKRLYQLLESRPDAKWVDFFQIFPHPAKLEMDDGLPLIRRRFVDSEHLKSLMENPYFEHAKLKEALESKFEPHIGDNSPLHYRPKAGERYELLDFFGPWDEAFKDEEGRTKTRKAVPYWIMVVNRKTAIRSIPNPYDHQQPPFTKVILYPDTKPSWFGVGIGQIGRPTQERLNKIVNQRLNNVDLVLNRQGLYNGNDPLINTKQLQVAKPGKFHKVSDTVSSIRWMDIPDVTASSYNEEKLAKQDFRESTGATSALLPSDRSGDQHRTALGIQLLQGAAGMRLRPVLRKMETDFIQKTAMFFFSNLKQFMAEEEWVTITSDNGQTEPVLVTREEIQAKVFFVPTGISETVNKETQVGQLLRFKEITLNDPTVNRQEINRRIAELLGFKEIQKLMVPQGPPQEQGAGNFITPEIGQQIRQRLAEGADPETVKQELIGAAPA